MAFQPHNIRDAQWGSFWRIPSSDTQFPPITAQVTETSQGTGIDTSGNVISPEHVENVVYDRFAILTEDYRAFSSNSTPTAISLTASSTSLLAANADRKGFKIINKGAAAIYILEGTGTASANNATAIIAANGNYESKFPVWTGALVGISSAGTNAIVVTEFT